MLNEMENFNREIDAVKQSVHSSQEQALESVRLRLSQASMLSSKFAKSTKKQKPDPQAATKAEIKDAIADQQKNYAEVLLAVKSIGIDNINEFLMLHQQSEEQVFGLYKNIQSLNEEMEILEVAIKHLETDLNLRTDQAKEIEEHNTKVKLQLESQISSMEKAMAMYVSSYSANCQVLESVSHFLMNILRNVAHDDEALDQQLLGTGVTDRSVDDHLGVIEQRVDELIQMLRAVSKQPIKTEDFLRTHELPPHVDKHMPQFHAVHGIQVTMPSATDGGDDDEDDVDENGKVQPINIEQLKDFMSKKVQKGLKKNVPGSNPAQHGTAFYLANTVDEKVYLLLYFNYFTFIACCFYITVE